MDSGRSVTVKKTNLIFVGQTLSDVDGISAIESLHTNGKNTKTPIVYSWEGIEKTLLERATAVGTNISSKAGGRSSF